jgi:hypothetical protein
MYLRQGSQTITAPLTLADDTSSAAAAANARAKKLCPGKQSIKMHGLK